MLTFVVICNLLIALFNFWVVWKIYRWRQLLAKISKTLTRIEQRIHVLLYPAPELIVRGQTGTNHLRERYLILEQQLHQLSYILHILRLGSRLLKLSG